MGVFLELSVLAFFKSGGMLNLENRLDFPPTTKRLKVDVGLDKKAPNSNLWLSESNEVYVIGVEADLENCKCLRSLELGASSETALKSRFLLIAAAAGWRFSYILEPPAGIEPATFALRERRSTD